MQLPETPSNIEQLDLMKKLDAYARGEATWFENSINISPNTMLACRSLYSGLVRLVNEVFAPLLDKVSSREMRSFTMHDRSHGLKVAHLIWHILDHDKREHLTPPEIGLMVASAYFHDLGMALDDQERAKRLDADSDLWDMLELQEELKTEIDNLRIQSANPNVSETLRSQARQGLMQAEEILLCQDTRERHATYQRYEEVLNKLKEFHLKDPVKIPDVEACLSFEGDSFLEKLIDISVSHNQSADCLVQNNAHFTRPSFPVDYPVGSCSVDTHLVAAALRLADILDFDRERTPPILFYYLLPNALQNLENRSVLEWNKHLAISNWHIESDAIVFRGRTKSHIIHHTIVQFCSDIAKEIVKTRATFGVLKQSPWPFALPFIVKADIHEEGYRYIPYKFELDDEQVYKLLLGGAIYDNPLDAIRELVQNAVDACKLRDALTLSDEPYQQASKNNRIIVRYEEPTEICRLPRLSIIDTGTGMDAWIIEQWFLQVGRSYYHSSEFERTRIELRKKSLDFAPVSEFGIGFLASFLLADHVEIETALWEPLRGDTRKRTMQIDGPTRLIRLDEHPNNGGKRFKGTRVSLFLARKTSQGKTTAIPSWKDVKEYLEAVCQDLPYRLDLEYVVGGEVIHDYIDPLPINVEIPQHLATCTIRVPVNDSEAGLEGEIILVNPLCGKQVENALAGEMIASVREDKNYSSRSSRNSDLLRGGFRVSDVPGLPTSYSVSITAKAKLRVTWQSRSTRRFLQTNLARNTLDDREFIAKNVNRLWLAYLLDNISNLPKGQLYTLKSPRGDLRKCYWLEQYDAGVLYRLAVLGLQAEIGEEAVSNWEAGKTSLLLPVFFEETLYWQLLDLICPKITSLQMRAQARYSFKPLKDDWFSFLEGWRNYITQPVSWGLFVEYTSSIKDLLFYQYSGSKYLNLHFQNRVSSLSEDDIVSLISIFDKLIRSRGMAAYKSQKRVELTKHEVLLFHRSLEMVGDLLIGSIGEPWPVNSFNLPDTN
jgi:hypothetical protein